MDTVFHLSSDGHDKVETALSNIENLLADETVDTGDIQVVVNASGVRALMPQAAHTGRIKDLIQRGVEIKACTNSLSGIGLEVADLIDGVEGVSSGVGHLTRLQSQGYAYIRP